VGIDNFSPCVAGDAAPGIGAVFFSFFPRITPHGKGAICADDVKGEMPYENNKTVDINDATRVVGRGLHAGPSEPDYFGMGA
jgi:hypothetical protein